MSCDRDNTTTAINGVHVFIIQEGGQAALGAGRQRISSRWRPDCRIRKAQEAGGHEHGLAGEEVATGRQTAGIAWAVL